MVKGGGSERGRRPTTVRGRNSSVANALNISTVFFKRFCAIWFRIHHFKDALFKVHVFLSVYPSLFSHPSKQVAKHIDRKEDQ